MKSFNNLSIDKYLENRDEIKDINKQIAVLKKKKKPEDEKERDKIEKDLLVCSVLNGKPTQMEFLIAHGDSGGGLFIDQKLAGIHSMIWNYGRTKPMATYSTYSGHTRISIYRNWIFQIRPLQSYS